MKRLLLAGVLAIGASLLVDASVSAFEPVSGIGANQCRRIGRIYGYWKNPTTGPLFDYSAYFATYYPQIPGAAEYARQPNQPGGPGSQNVPAGAVKTNRMR
jgi:hypothetical protein